MKMKRIDEHRQAFMEETSELLADLEAALVELEERPEDGELIGRIFRALHTVKGTAGMFGLERITAFTHQFESVFDMVRNGDLAVGSELISCSLEAKDQILRLLEAGETEGAEEELRSREILEALQRTAGCQEKACTVCQGVIETTVSISDYLGVLTEYEISRIRASLRKNRNLYLLKMVVPLEGLAQSMAEISRKLSCEGELISNIPTANGAPAGSLGFEFLFSSREDAAAIGARIGTLPSRVDGSVVMAEEAGEIKDDHNGLQSTYRIRFKPEPESLKTGLNPLKVIEDLRQLGNCFVVAHTDNVPELDKLDPEICYVYWDIILSTGHDQNEIRDLFIFFENGSEFQIEEIDDGSHDAPGVYKRLGEILVERGDLSAEELKSVLCEQKPIGEMLVEARLVTQATIESALIEQKHINELRKERQKRQEHHESQDTATSLRVPAQKLDQLVNLVGEMVTVQARLSQNAPRFNDPELVSIAEEVERLTAELRDTTLNIRMLPIGSTFNKLKRLVRDLSGELHKSVELTTSGADTELDKTVIEKLNDPLVHLIRNCIDHGIESPGLRVAAGKPQHGTIHLAANHIGDSVLITIRDDGAGLNLPAIRAKAVEKGIISGVSELSDKEANALIFTPGFSTATRITDVSGRGVGMDVVKRSIESLRGSIDISSSQGAGTEISIKLPLTLAIIESLLVEIGPDRFVLPLSIVEECVELTISQRLGGHGDLVDVRGQLIPYINLRERFAITGQPPDIQQVVIMGLGTGRVGVVVDHVVGEHQAVIKSLGKFYKNVDEVSGATILGDGSVALIVDVGKLAAEATGSSRFA